MKAIMVMFDTLNRRFLSPYGCDWTHTPNFNRLAERTATFDNAYVGSMPCMPARRELHTGRYNFLHRSWGPLEPFDDSMPDMLRKAGVYTHLTSDHYHYWEEGGATYHTKYNSWEISRGQESDGWKGQVADPEPGDYIGQTRREYLVNQKHMQREECKPQAVTFANGMEFLRTNADQDNWFLHIETFDPHEPYFVGQEFKDLYPHDYDGPTFDWPKYGHVTQTPEQVEHCRLLCAALTSMCDAYLGKVLDMMDELDLWKDTMLIVNTDHGFLMGEHDWWAKCAPPFYNEVAHTPLFIWDPRSGARGVRRQSLVQTIDLAPTLLDCFGLERPADMQGTPLRETVASDTSVRQAGLYGIFGGHINCTDGRYTYMRAPVREDNTPLYEHTLMPTHMRVPFAVDELQAIELADPFDFTKGCKTMRIAGRAWRSAHELGTMLFDLQADPEQSNPIDDPAVEKIMIDHMVRLMKDNDCPADQFERLGLAGAQ